MKKRLRKKVKSFYQLEQKKQLKEKINQLENKLKEEKCIAIAFEEVLVNAHSEYKEISRKKEMLIDQVRGLDDYVSELSQDKNILRKEIEQLNKIILVLKEQNTNLALEVDRVDAERTIIASENVELTDTIKNLRSRGLLNRIINKEVAI